jgi:hypothetical protein
MARLARYITALIIALGCLGPSQADSIALDFTGGIGFFSVDTDTMAGWSFSVSSAVTVDGLGFFDVQPDGLRISHDVGLWTASGIC